MKILDSLRGLYLNLFEHTDVAHFYGYIEIETLDTFYLAKKKNRTCHKSMEERPILSSTIDERSLLSINSFSKIIRCNHILFGRHKFQQLDR
jgi:hypothetical protein